LKAIPHVALLTCLLLAPRAQGADESAPLPQVTVEATRANVAKLGKEVQMSEFRFYELYNTLNKNPDYAIKCANEAPTGSRFKRTECHPVFKIKAEEQEARDFIRAFGGGSAVSGVGAGLGPAGTSPPQSGAGAFGPAIVAISAARPGFRKNMIEVTTRSPELTRLAQEHAELWNRFFALYRKLNGAGPPPEEKAPAPAAPPSSEGAR
jgi:hypothetical protein